MNPRAIRSEAQVYALVLGAIVLQLRRRAGFSQTAAAASVGITQAALSRIERGKTHPGAFALSRIATALGVTLGWVDDVAKQAMRRSAVAVRALACAELTQPWWEAAEAIGGTCGLEAVVSFAVAAAAMDRHA